MAEGLFVYGSLGPGGPNEHVLAAIGGNWRIASVMGTLRSEGWGAALGYPGIQLGEDDREVRGFLFTSENLSQHWAALDEFEGASYQRVLTTVKLEDDTTVTAYIYALRDRT
jgi:gamma-glutamylcyclotransferase (GGCT)/AIG2-like uncharacterized protein YtfP